MSRTTTRLLTALASTAVACAAAWLWLRARNDPTVELPAPSGVFGAKDGDTFRIYVLGGSAAAGCPFEERLDYGRLLAYAFDGRLRGRPIQVRRYAGSGEDSLDVYRDAQAILAEEKDPANALVIVYSGNNEFVRFDTMHDLSKPERQLFDVPMVPRAKEDEIYATCERRLEEITRAFLDRGMHVLVSTIAVNLKDWEPERSVLDDPAHASLVQSMLDEGEAKAASGELEAARERFAAARALEPRFAWAAWREGRMLLALERWDDARDALQAALDANAAPNASSSRENAMLRALAKRTGAVLVDSESIVKQAAPHAIPGFETFWDNCHPTLEGYVRIANGMRVAVEKELGERAAHPDPSVDEIAAAMGIDAPYMAKIWTGRGVYFYVASCLIWTPTARLAKADEFLTLAERVTPDDGAVLCSRAVLSLFRGELESSRGYWIRARAADPILARTRLRAKYVRSLLRRHGVDDAEAWLAEKT